MNARSAIIITDIDERRISRLLDIKAGELDAPTLELLEDELSGAKVVKPAEIPATVVTMDSLVLFEDADTGERSEVTLIYPGAHAAGPGRVSVLAPIGAALLGLTVGDAIEWPMPGGHSRRVRVLAVRSPR